MAALLTIGYQDKDPRRLAELLFCLSRNINSGMFSRVVVFMDGRADKYEGFDADIVNLTRRQTYSDLFGLAQSRFSNEDFIVLANGDIYFDQTLLAFKGIDLTDRFYAISRRELLGTDKLSTPHNPFRSQDAWVFKCPIRRFDWSIPMGLPGCDQRLAHEAKRSGLKISNPCLSINAIHVHATKVRRYKSGDRLRGRYAEIGPGTL